MFKFIVSLGLLKYINALFPFLVLPFVSRILSPEDFSLYFLTNIYMTVLQPFMSFNIQTGQRKLSVENNSDRQILCTTASIFLVLMASMIFLIGSTTTVIGLLSGDVTIVLLVTVAALGVSLNSSLDTYFVTKMQALNIYLYSIFTSIAVWGGMLYLLVEFETWTARLISQGVVYTLIAISWFMINRSYMLTNLSREFFTRLTGMLRIGMPLVPVIICDLILLHADKLFAPYVLDAAGLSQYTAFSQVALMPMFFALALSYGLEPIILKEKKGNLLFRGLKKLFILVLFVFLVTLVLQKSITFVFVNQEIEIFNPILSLLIIGYFFKVIVAVCAIFFIAHDLQNALMKRYVVLSAVYLIFILLTLKVLGALQIAVMFLVIHLILLFSLIGPLRKRVFST